MARKPHILIVEDEEAIRTGLIDVLLYHGFSAQGVADGKLGLAEAQSGKYDLVLLDVMLPGINGFDICNQIRETDREQPIIMLTAKTADEDIIHGLQLGADDYVSKPFSVAQLVLRIQAVLRRAGKDINQEHNIELDKDFTIDIRNLSAQRDAEQIAFTRREMDLLQYLYANRERPVPREELLNKIWGYAKNLDIETRTVDIHIAKLRRKIETDPSSPRFLLTVRGAGYRLQVH